ncbi:MAG: protein GlmU [Desulfobacterales bacterium]|nr:protein GlmU [Desulfobacterales bacterium]
MELKPKCRDKIIQLINKGVNILNPLTLDIGEDVDVDRISGNDVKIYPGCRIYGKETVIAEGAQIGYEAPVTIDNCQIGPSVELKGGYFNNAVFLEKAGMGSGAHVREGCILEEQSNGAHCVGLKQTILFPFVTLGSLINFCDCLMSGGTSRNNHSEVGSCYIHFNFTPDGDKTTPSLIGDVPRGVMLKQPPIFLGGQGGIVGPIRLGYGNVVAAGTIIRNDFVKNNKLIFERSYRKLVTDFIPNRYVDISSVVKNNILYMANLTALEQWYIHVRRLFFIKKDFDELIYLGLLDKLSLAKKERIKRIKAMADKISPSIEKNDQDNQWVQRKREFLNNIEQILELFEKKTVVNAGSDIHERFMNAFEKHKQCNPGSYIETIKSLPSVVAEDGILWLDKIIQTICKKTAQILPSLRLFDCY